MKVYEAIKNIDNFVITKSGKFLGISNDNNLKIKSNNYSKDYILNSEVKKIEIIKGVISDITAFRL